MAQSNQAVQKNREQRRTVETSSAQPAQRRDKVKAEKLGRRKSLENARRNNSQADEQNRKQTAKPTPKKLPPRPEKDAPDRDKDRSDKDNKK